MPKLVFTDAKFAGLTYQFVRETTRVGRADDNLLVIRDPSVSSRHCEILVNGQEVIVRDLDSRNGTFVNGSRLKGQQAQVKSGGTVRFGTVDARIEMELPDSRDEATEITAIYAHNRAMHDPLSAKPPPSDPVVKIEPSEAAGYEERTILVPNQISAAPLSGSRAVEFAAPSADRVRRTGRWLVVVLAVTGLAVLAWLLWFRK